MDQQLGEQRAINQTVATPTGVQLRRLFTVAVVVARVAGIALVSLSVACWPGTALIGMVIYSAAITLYFAYVGFAGGFSGRLLWPAVIVHVILTALLARATTSKEIKS